MSSSQISNLEGPLPCEPSRLAYVRESKVYALPVTMMCRKSCDLHRVVHCCTDVRDGSHGKVSPTKKNISPVYSIRTRIRLYRS